MPNELWIYDTIGEGFFESGVTDKSVRDDLAKFKNTEPLLVRINSPGGDIMQAVAIKTMLDQWKGEVSIQVDGLAASAASFIATTGGRVTMADGALYMLHNPWTVAVGDSRDMRKQAEVLDKIGGKLIEAYARRSGKGEPAITKMMDEETWLTSDECVEQGFADEVIKETAAAAFAVPAVMGFKHPPTAPVEPKQRPAGRLAALQRQLQQATNGVAR